MMLSWSSPTENIEFQLHEKGHFLKSDLLEALVLASRSAVNTMLDIFALVNKINNKSNKKTTGKAMKIPGPDFDSTLI